MSEDLPTIVISDANVVIDYWLTNRSILRLVTRHLWSVRIPRQVLEEVEQLDEESATALGLEIVEAEPEDLIVSATRSGNLSRPDKLCYLMAKRNGWGCWTNDGGLRKACEGARVIVYWGMEAMLLLSRKGRLTRADAARTATDIHKVNGRHVTKEILEKFLKKLDA